MNPVGNFNLKLNPVVKFYSWLVSLFRCLSESESGGENDGVGAPGAGGGHRREPQLQPPGTAAVGREAVGREWAPSQPSDPGAASPGQRTQSRR